MTSKYSFVGITVSAEIFKMFDANRGLGEGCAEM